MKRILIIFAAVILSGILFAQVPQKICYQAVIRNTNNNLVTSHAIGIRVSILQGTNPVYVETQATPTDINGLMTIEIGGGTVISGVSFASIDWSLGSYFLKTEADPTGGTNYSAIVGTNSLLSVPYALYAQTSGGVTGAHYPGELYGGGVVFWVDHTGQHGLICSMIDLSTGMAWSNVTTTAVGTTAQSDWDGSSNSLAIITQSTHTTSAAKICLDYSNADYGTGIYSDWYLPSRGELNDLWNNLKVVQKALDSDGNATTISIAKKCYWSSSESDQNATRSYHFMSGDLDSDPKTDIDYVRAVRSF